MAPPHSAVQVWDLPQRCISNRCFYVPALSWGWWPHAGARGLGKWGSPRNSLRTTTWPDGGLGDNLLDTIFVTSRKFVPSFSHTILRYAMLFYVQASVAVLEPPLEATKGEVRGEDGKGPAAAYPKVVAFQVSITILLSIFYPLRHLVLSLEVTHPNSR